MERSHLYGRSRTSPWKYGDYENYYKEDQEYLLGFSWPPRSYTCSFCKREFRSAQALGGHMNVHRRDRARLRLQQQCSSSSSSTPSPPYPNPNYSNYSSMPTSPPLPPPLTLFPSTLSPPSSPCSRSCLESSLSPNKSRHTQEKACVLSKKDGCKFLKNDEVMSLGLEVGLINEPEEDIDLELRLGFTN